MRLHELLDRVATADEPVSRLDAEALFAGGERHRRHTRIVRGAGAVGAAAIALAVVVVVSTVGAAPKTESERPAGVAPDTFVVHRVGGHDRNHLWVWGEVAPGRGFVVASTTDGGRTWRRHNEPNPADRQIVVDNIGLLWAVDGPSGVSAFPITPRGLQYTLDGWRTRDTVLPSGTAVASAPENALVFCERTDDWIETWTCEVSVFDPASRTYAPLANQPALRTSRAVRAPDGVIWAIGLDRSTNRPATARSVDGGVTWSTHGFTELPAHGSEDHVLHGSFMFNHKGAALLTMLGADPAMQHVVRFTDGRWQRLPDINPRQDASNWLTDDGTYVRPVVQSSQPSPAPSSDSWSPPPMINKVVGVRICPPGGTVCHDAEPPKGLPTEQALIGVIDLPGGGYLGYNFGGLWFSSDGLAWQRVPGPK